MIPQKEKKQSENNHQTNKVVPTTRVFSIPKPIPRPLFSQDPSRSDPHPNFLSLNQKNQTDGNKFQKPSLTLLRPFEEPLLISKERETNSPEKNQKNENKRDIQQNQSSLRNRMTKESKQTVTLLKKETLPKQGPTSGPTKKETDLGIIYNRPNQKKLFDIETTLFYIKEAYNSKHDGKEFNTINCNCGDVLKKRNAPDDFDSFSFNILSFLHNKDDPSLKRFGEVYEQLLLLFLEKTVEVDLAGLKQIPFILFAKFVERKFGVPLKSPTDRRGLRTLFTKIEAGGCEKRPEECKKLVFSMTIKHLKNKLRCNYKKIYRKKSFESYFYYYYFNEIAKKERIPIQDFYYPVSYNKNKRNAFKTINKQYIENIKKSRKFIADFLNYICGSLVEDYKGEVAERLMEMVGRWDRAFVGPRSEEWFGEELKRHFGGGKLKLPWTVGEVEKAVETVKQLLDD